MHRGFSPYVGEIEVIESAPGGAHHDIGSMLARILLLLVV